MSKRSNDRFPKILVLHPGWRNPGGSGDKLLVNGLNLNYLSDDETNLLRMIIDPGFELKYYENLLKKNLAVANEYNKIIGAASSAIITSPHDFYLRVVKPFIEGARGWDPYRLYDPTKMLNTKVLQTQRQMLGQYGIEAFGSNPPDHGKDEKSILADLAKKDVLKTQLTPQEQKFIRILRGKSQQLFQNYKSKFQHMKGPLANNRTPNFKGNQKNPPWMDDEV